MKTIALRFGEQFSPDCGTIVAHQELIDELNHVWYGKMGTPVADKIIEEIMNNQNPKILLIQSGGQKRYWAYISEVSKETPPLKEIPEYYRNNTTKFKTWFNVMKFEPASKHVLSKCKVISSGNNLSEASKHSLSPYFIIEYQEEDGD